MSATHSSLVLWCLLGYVAWAMLLVMLIVSTRGLVIMRGEKKINEFPSGEPHGSELYRRLNRAHANVVENLPLVAIVFALFYVFVAPSPLVAWLPLVALGGRVVQTVAHVASGSAAAVSVRFAGFAVQYACVVGMMVAIVRALPVP
jgi:uncharacterized membrane protein YecN with MAPEG domain